MRIFAYCTASAIEAVESATCVEALTSPPMRVADFNPAWLEGHDLLYFRLHGVRGSSAWFGDADLPALVPAQVRVADLGGAVVVAANCWGAENARMVQALYEAGASVVIAGGGLNLAAAGKVVGTDLLVQWVIRMLRVGLRIEQALRVARVRLALTGWRESDRDAARFKIVRRGEDGKQTI